MSRYDELMRDPTKQLTKEEKDNGWFFCCEWDGMLTHKSHAEAGICTCHMGEESEC